MRRESFAVHTAGGQLAGWIDGDGPNVLLLHGGPGLSADYLDSLIPELVPGYRVALYQQRGLPPSTEEGPFTVASHLADVAAVLSGLGWDKAYLAGHSWGGHLAIHAAAAFSERLNGVLCIDPVGGVGDGGVAAFEAAMTARTPETSRARAKELDDRALRGEGSESDALESFSLLGRPISRNPRPPHRRPPSVWAFSAMRRATSPWSRNYQHSSRGFQESKSQSVSLPGRRVRSRPTRQVTPRPRESRTRRSTRFPVRAISSGSRRLAPSGRRSTGWSARPRKPRQPQPSEAADALADVGGRGR